MSQLSSLALALLIFPLFIWVPGATLAYGADLLGFRQVNPLTQLAIGLIISLSCLPIVVYLLGRSAGFQAVWAFLAIVWTCAAILALIHSRSLLSSVRGAVANHAGALIFIVIFVIAGAAFEMDYVTSRGVHLNLGNIDATAHVATTDAITRTGIPPVNPFVYPGHPVRLMYYYGWYLICSLVDRLGGAAVSARAAVQAGKIYVGLGLVALIDAYMEISAAQLFPDFKKLNTRVAIGLLAVTGLDLIPWSIAYAIYRFTGRGPGDMLSLEWWNEQITAWVGALLMSPHHPAALIMCMTGLLLILGMWLRPSAKLLLMGLAALAFASAAATSIYVTLAFAAGLLLWLVFAATRGWWTDVYQISLIGAVAALLYLPMALELAAASTTRGIPIAFTIRAFLPSDYWLPAVIRSLRGSSLLYVLRLVFLPLNYFLELGFFAVAAVLFWSFRRSRNRPLTKEESLITCVALGSILICTFFRSSLHWNDLGWRGFLVAQFVLLLWAVPVAQSLLESKKPDSSALVMNVLRWRSLVVLTLIIGVAGTAFEVYNLRSNFPEPVQPATIGARDAFIWVDQHTPRNTVVLFNPDRQFEYFNALYGHRQAAVDGRTYAFLYGGVAANSTGVLTDALALFTDHETVDDVRQVSERYHVGAIVVLSSDPVWNDSSSWVWKMSPAFTTASSKVYVTPELSNTGSL